jgi:transposase
MPTITTKELTTLKIAKRHHHTVKSRLAIVDYATKHGIKGAARRFGLDRKTVRAWRRRWQVAGLSGLVPRYPPIRARRISDATVALIEHARRGLKYGAVRTRIWLECVHRIRVAAATIRRICHRLGYPSLRRKPSRRPRQLMLFSRERPGDCVQVDVKEVKVAGTKCFQYTAIDDCTRYRVLRLYPQKNQQTSHTFFTTLRTTLPFPIRKLQVDNGTEFPLAFALTVEQAGMRLRYIKPRCPEQNGKSNAVIALMRRNFGVGRHLPASRRRPRHCSPGNTATTTTASPWPSRASLRPKNSPRSRPRRHHSRHSQASRTPFPPRPRPWTNRRSPLLSQMCEPISLTTMT